MLKRTTFVEIMLDRYPRFFALAFTLCFFALIWRYVLEYPYLYNAIGTKTLIYGSMVAGLLVALAIIFGFRKRFTPWGAHVPEVMFILVLSVVFSPLFGSWLNRGLGTENHESFEFLAETPFVASGYGILKGEKVKPSGYFLTVRENGRILRFKYTKQAYYPLTKPGETILLPVRKGIFGIRVMTLI